MTSERPSTPGVAQVRAALLADVAGIARFQTDCWREAYRGVVPQDYLDRVSYADRELRWRERLLTGARQIALAEADNAVAGVVSWRTIATQDPDTGLSEQRYVRR